MTEDEAGAVVATLIAGYHREKIPNRTIELYASALADLDFEDGMAAVKDILRTSRYWPTIAEIRLAVVERQLGLPSALEAWEMVNQPRGVKLSALPEPVARALEAVGGKWEINTSDNPGVVRGQFTRYYEQARREAVERLVIGRESVAGGREALKGGAASELPPGPKETLSLEENAEAAHLMVDALAGKISYEEVQKRLPARESPEESEETS